MSPEMVQLARTAAATEGLDPALVLAVVAQESGGNPWLSRYEPGFFARYIDKSAIHIVVQEFCRKAPYTVSFETELRERATSRGLMQILGQVAREQGFLEPIPKLHDAPTGLQWGCKFLRKCLDRNNGDTRRALLRWNGGSDPLYPDKVFNRMEQYV